MKLNVPGQAASKEPDVNDLAESYMKKRSSMIVTSNQNSSPMEDQKLKNYDVLSN